MLDKPLLNALLVPLDELCNDYEETLAILGQVSGDLAAMRARIRGAADSTTQLKVTSAVVAPGLTDPPPLPATSEPLRPVQMRVTGTDFEQLLSLQQHLSEADGVVSVAITGMESGRATLLVNMAEPGPSDTDGLRGLDAPEDLPPTLVCAWCHTVLSVGGPALSHGLCAPCAAPFMPGNQR